MLLILTFSSVSDKDKFEYLYERYKRLLLRKAYDILGDHALAEDAVSEAYIRIYRNLHKIDDPASNRSIAFAVTIAKNAALTMLKKERAIPVAEYGEDIADGTDVEESVLGELSAERIMDAMQSLTEELRSAFTLRYAHGYSPREIGALLGISENNVTVRLHRARKKLAELLGKEGYAHG